MKKAFLNQNMDQVFRQTSEEIIEMKSALMGLCTDIERYFRIAFDVDLNEEITQQEFEKVLRCFPLLKSINLEQYNRLVLLFINIRGISAHLFLTKPLHLDNDLKEFIKKEVHPRYFIENDGLLTIYGCAIILSLFAQKYMIWSFCTCFFRHEYFFDIGRSDAMSAFQIEQQKILNGACGTGKPIVESKISDVKADQLFLNDTLKRCLTRVFFDLENTLSETKKCCGKVPSIASILKRSPAFNEDLISEIVELRNCWFHGCFIGDRIYSKTDHTKFTLKYAINILKKILKTTECDKNYFFKVINDIYYLGQGFFNHYVLRLIEVSYKILDKRLLTEDKLESRLDNAETAYAHFLEIDSEIYELFADLITYDNLRWKVGASKFLDKMPRGFDTNELKIAKIHSYSGFQIGDYKTSRMDIVLVILDGLNKNFENLINGKSIESLKYDTVKEYSKFIKVVSVKCE